MSTRLRVPIAFVAACSVVVAGAVAPQAGAKGLARLAVCGGDGCVDRTAAALRASEYPELLISGGTPVAEGAATPEPFVRLRIGIGDGVHGKVLGRMRLVLLPRGGFVRSEDGGWYRATGDQLRALRRVARGVPRLPAARLRLAEPVEAVPTAAATVAAASVDGAGGGVPWAAVALAAVAAAGGGVALAVRRRRATGGPAAAGGPVR